MWNTDAVNGCRRFLTRFYDMVCSNKVCEEESDAANKLAHRLVDKVLRDIEALSFNTSIAKMMEFVNNFTKLEKYPKSALKYAVQALYSFAPHIAEELWQQIGEDVLLHDTGVQEYNPAYLVKDEVNYVIQIMGKIRGKIEVSTTATQDEIKEMALKVENVQKYLEGKEIKKIIVVPKKLVSIVAK